MSVAKERAPVPSPLSHLSLKLDHHGFDLQDELFSDHTNTFMFASADNFPSPETPPPPHPLINFKSGSDHQSPTVYSASAVLSFEHKLSHGDLDSLSWIRDAIDNEHGYQIISSEATCFRMLQEKGLHKRPLMDAGMQASKKHCGSSRKLAKRAKGSSSAKDPQSIAAKNRRERISERLKTLQSLVPNGTKVDLVTMLEKAITYVKFLQLQIKVLSTDEFWPAQGGGKATEASQVNEAINGILSLHRGRMFSPNY